MENRTYADLVFLKLIEEITLKGYEGDTRNYRTKFLHNPFHIRFASAPLVTVTKTAWKTGIGEWDWFFSGNSECPKILLDWWAGQLNPVNYHHLGYAQQFSASEGTYGKFNQIKNVLYLLKNNPTSREIILTAWNPGDMVRIKEENENPKTPANCHSTIIQFFVYGKILCCTCYQRSADLLLGVKHNWIQSWAMLNYFAKQCGLEVGTMDWVFGNVHIYQEQSHLDQVNSLLKMKNIHKYNFEKSYTLNYQPTSENFIASDFSILEDVDSPLVNSRPTLL